MMKEFLELIDDKEFVNYVLEEYFYGQNMTNEEKLKEVSSSLHDFKMARESFNLSSFNHSGREMNKD